MKNFKVFVLTVAVAFAMSLSFVNAQEEEIVEKESPVSVGGDLVSRYIFRGLDFGSSPAIQPGIEASLGNFTVGAWGSYSFIATPSGIEADLYAGYTFGFGLYAGVTDYYFPGESLMLNTADYTIAPSRSGSYFDYENSHFFELNLIQEVGDFYLAANWMFSSNMDNDLYFEAGYSLSFMDVFIGGGNEVYTTGGDFQIVNVGLSASKEVKLGGDFSLPISTSLILNPNTEQIHLVLAVSL